MTVNGIPLTIIYNNAELKEFTTDISVAVVRESYEENTDGVHMTTEYTPRSQEDDKDDKDVYASDVEDEIEIPIHTTWYTFLWNTFYLLLQSDTREAAFASLVSVVRKRSIVSISNLWSYFTY